MLLSSIFSIISDHPNIRNITEPDVHDTFGLSDLPEEVIEYHLCPYLSDRDITNLTTVKYHLIEILYRALRKREEKSKFSS